MLSNTRIVIPSFRKLPLLLFITTLLIVCACSPASGQGPILIGYAPPWSAGENTLKEIQRISPYSKYNVKLIKAKERFSHLNRLLAKKSVDIGMLTHSQWFTAINAGLPFLAIAETGLHLAVVNEPVYRKKEKHIVGFLLEWQKSWPKTDYPYGVQPPPIDFLISKYEGFLVGLGVGLGPAKVNLETKYFRKFMVPVLKAM